MPTDDGVDDAATTPPRRLTTRGRRRARHRATEPPGGGRTEVATMIGGRRLVVVIDAGGAGRSAASGPALSCSRPAARPWPISAALAGAADGRGDRPRRSVVAQRRASSDRAHQAACRRGAVAVRAPRRRAARVAAAELGVLTRAEGRESGPVAGSRITEVTMTPSADTPGRQAPRSDRRPGATSPSPEADRAPSDATETDETAATAGRRSRRLLGYRRQRFEARKVRRLDPPRRPVVDAQAVVAAVAVHVGDRDDRAR